MSEQKKTSTEKPAKDQTLEVTLEVREIQSWSPIIRLIPNAVLALTPATLGDAQDLLKKEVEEAGGVETYSEVEEAWNVLRETRIKRDKNDKPELDQQGRAQGLPFDIDDQRWRNRVLNVLEKAKSKKPSKTVKIVFHTDAKDMRPKWEDAVLFAKAMKIKFNEYNRVLSILPELFDKYVEIQKRAETLVETRD